MHCKIKLLSETFTIFWRSKIPVWLFVCTAFKIFRSSHNRCSIKIGVLKNFAKFTGKHCARVSFVTLLKKRPWHRCFSWKFCKIFKSTFFIEHIWTTASEYYGIKNDNSVNSHLFQYFYKFITSKNSSCSEECSYVCRQGNLY